MADAIRESYERAAHLEDRAARGDPYAAKWAAIHQRLADLAVRNKSTGR